MQLYMKQKVFSFGDKFTVKDANGMDRWFIEGELFSFGHRLHVFDANGVERALLQQKLFSFMPRFIISVDGNEVAQMVKEFTLFKQRYFLDGLPWELEGNFWTHDYQLFESGTPIMHVTKEWFTWGDSYALNIADGVDELLCLCVVLAVDCVLEASQNSG